MTRTVRVPVRARAGLLALLLVAGAAAGGAAGPRVTDFPCVLVSVGGAEFSVRLAASAETRARGFQNVSPGIMRDNAIYFRYAAPTRPSFHMRNVAAPLSIAWIGPRHRVLRVDRMDPGSEGHRPPARVVGALEFVPEHALAQQLRPGVRVRLPAGAGEAACRGG